MASHPSRSVTNPIPNMFGFSSRRSVVHSVEGIVACTQPLAAKCGLDILRAGGNAAVRPSAMLLSQRIEKSISQDPESSLTL
ncbi:hypothetical protein E4U16_001397 [Claviceps sp. LM84 group G4]|nr:hypothetical protein E4U16_001397 [Claviceps sp. LM84 group G4]